MIKKPLVSIDCITYNHAPYIRQCLEGFLMQETDFSFEVLIHDDASTDETANIIREYELKYPDLINPIYQNENQWSKGKNISVEFNFPRARGKYIALCEGDDHWTDPLKLQKQVSILESDENIGFVYSKFRLIDFDNKPINSSLSVLNQFSRSKTGYLLPYLLRNNFPQTLTVIFRKNLIIDVAEYYTFIYDWPLFIHICGKCKAVFIPEVMGCYRINPLGMINTGVLTNLDSGGCKTLSGAFNAYLDGKYSSITFFGKIKALLYIYYRTIKSDIDDIDILKRKLNKDIIFVFLEKLKNIGIIRI